METALREYNVQQIIIDLQDAMDFVNGRVINRGDIVEQIFCALLTAEHALIQSRTGVGKSLLTEQIFMMFGDARYFKVQASKEQQPDTYFGGLEFEALRQGRIVHNTAGTLVESEFGFIDEIFDANDFTLRALLSLLNERELVLGAQRRNAEIHTVIAATNYLRVSEVTEAVLDRFAYQSVAFPDKDPHDQYLIAQQYLQHGGRPAPPPKQIPFSVLRWVTSICRGESTEMRIEISPEIVYYANLVIRYYEELRNRQLSQHPELMPGRDYYISPRKQMKAFDLLRAITLLHGRTTVTTDDVDKLYLLFTTVGLEEERTIWKKASATLGHQFAATGALEQVRTLLDFKVLLDQIKRDPQTLQRPLSSLDNLPVKRTLREWARETLGMVDVGVEQNRRLIEEFLVRFQPTTDEVRDLRERLQADVRMIFRVRAGDAS
ncbi:MAG TPA: AAA family ATPase [Candidatus Kapabacteria bacterium]|jgi:MoxR-like ATPase|nr:AAA family ATPase [Candidatus Kapabacteria bacterium]